MITKEELKSDVISQREELDLANTGIKREGEIDENASPVLIISGIRRSGKSTLMKQVIGRHKSANYFNFEDPRVIDFDIKDFERLQNVFEEVNGKVERYFFDEVQNVDGWE